MPAIPSNEKNAFLAIVSASPDGLALANRLATILVNYSDIPRAIVSQLRLYAANNNYLLQALGCFDSTQLGVIGIHVNANQNAMTNPFMLINSTVTTVTITEASPVTFLGLAVLGNTTIKTLYLSPGTTLNELIVGPGATIDSLNASAVSSPVSSQCVVQKISLWFDRSTPSAINSVTYGSAIGSVYVEGQSYYGGISENPDLTCAASVTNLQVSNVTNDSMYVSWDLPNLSSPFTQYLFVNIYFRLSNTLPWIKATADNGDFAGDSGFLFRGLEENTYYDFNICCTCLNGGVSCVSIMGKTVCCSSPL